MHLAKQVDPEGRRTVGERLKAFRCFSNPEVNPASIGVLTKPDTLQEREEGRWLDIMEGRLHQLAHGYYMTKQPTPADLDKGISHSEAREAEKIFFETNPIWSRCHSQTRSKMGMHKLGIDLSILLSQLIGQT